MKKIVQTVFISFLLFLPVSVMAVTPEGGGDPTAGSGNFATGEGVAVGPVQSEVMAQEVQSENRNSEEASSSDTKPEGVFLGVNELCFSEGQCSACDILVVFINIANLILGSLAIVATIFFVWGAGYLMLSSGNEQRIEKGKNIIKATVIGTVIVLFAWQAMSVIVYVITQQEANNGDGYNPITSWYNAADQCRSKVKNNSSDTLGSTAQCPSGYAEVTVTSINQDTPSNQCVLYCNQAGGVVDDFQQVDGASCCKCQDTELGGVQCDEIKEVFDFVNGTSISSADLNVCVNYCASFGCKVGLNADVQTGAMCICD